MLYVHHQKRRFYCFSTRLPDESKEARDVLNEMPTEDERNAALDLGLVPTHPPTYPSI